MTIKIGDLSESAKTNSKIIIENDKTKKESGIPDGGWGWVVLFATVVMRMLISGVYVSFGLFISEFLIEFNSNQTILTWLVSFNQAINLGITPVASLLSKRFSHRAVSLVGSVIVSVSFIIPYFCPKLWMIFLSASILNGVGQGFIYLSSTVILTTYFDKRLSIILGIYSSGFGMASFAMAPLVSCLITAVGWRLTMLIYGSILSICIFLSFTFRPVNLNKICVNETELTQTTTPEKKSVEKTEDQGSDPSTFENLNLECISNDDNHNISVSMETKILEEDITDFNNNVINMQNTDLQNKDNTITPDVTCTLAPKEDPNLESKQIITKGKNEYALLLQNPIFLLFLFSNLLMFSGYDNTYVYTKLKATEAGVSESKALVLLTLIGVGNVVGRLAFGYLGSLKRINVYLLYVSCLVMAGTSILFSRVAFIFPLMVIYTCSFGFFVGGAVTLNAFVLTVILDISQFSTGLAMTSFIQAMGLLGGAPLSGFIYDSTKSLNWSFIVSGSFIVSSGLCLLLAFSSKTFRKSQKLW